MSRRQESLEAETVNINAPTNLPVPSNSRNTIMAAVSEEHATHSKPGSAQRNR